MFAKYGFSSSATRTIGSALHAIWLPLDAARSSSVCRHGQEAGPLKVPVIFRFTGAVRGASC